MFRYRLLPEIDFPLCVSCGQVFRWTDSGGVDGAFWYDREGSEVFSNAPEAEFLRLFQVTEQAAARAVFEKDSVLAPLVESWPGLHMMAPSDPVETLFSFLCTSNNHLSRITQMVRFLAGASPQDRRPTGLHLTGTSGAGPAEPSGVTAPSPSPQFADAHRLSPIEGEGSPVPGARALGPHLTGTLGAGPQQPSGATAPPPHPSSLRSQTLSPSGEGLQTEVTAPRFPNLRTLAQLTEAQLRANGFGYRAKTIPQVAQQLLQRGGEAYLENLKNTSHQKARQELIELPGVGPKLADCICLYALHQQESVPVDTHLWQAVTRHYLKKYQNEPLTAKRYAEVGDFLRDRFGLHAGRAHQYLFLDNLKNWREINKARKEAVQ